MKSWPVSDDARDRLQRLSDAPSPAERLEILEEFVAAAEVGAAIPLGPLVEHAALEVRRATMRVVDRLMAELQSEELPAFSRWARRGYNPFYYRWWKAWNGLSPGQLSTFDNLEVDAPRFWGLLTMHPNGFVREAALGRLAGVDSGVEIAYLLLRVGDWVPEIQTYAIDLLRKRLRPEWAGGFADNLVLVMRLLELERSNAEVLGNKIVDVLYEEDAGPALLDKIRTGRRRERRIAFSLVTNFSNAAARVAIEDAARSEDDVLRTEAVKVASEHLSRDEHRALLVRLRRDPHRVVRREVARRMLDHFPDEADAVLREMLFDSSAPNRQLSRFHLTRRGDWDFRKIYREALESTDPKRKLAGLHGLGDIGDKTVTERIISFVDDESRHLRRAALEALAHIDPYSHTEHFYTAIGDDARDVSRAAARALRDVGARLNGERLWSIYSSGYPGHVATNALHAGRGLPSWRRLGFFLLAVPVTDDFETRDRLIALLEAWCDASSRLFTTPSEDDAAKIRRAFSASRERLPEDLLRRLEEILNHKLS